MLRRGLLVTFFSPKLYQAAFPELFPSNPHNIQPHVPVTPCDWLASPQQAIRLTDEQPNASYQRNRLSMNNESTFLVTAIKDVTTVVHPVTVGIAKSGIYGALMPKSRFRVSFQS